MKYKKSLLVLLISSILGIAITGYLINQHYKPLGESFCNINEYISCDIVNKSEFSEILGIPVSVLGLLSYVFFTGVAIYWLKKGAVTKKMVIVSTLFCLVGLLFSLFLTYIEFFYLFAVCIFCLTQQLLILINFITLSSLWYRQKHA